MKVKVFMTLTVLIFVILIPTACGPDNNQGEEIPELKIAAASSLTLPFTKMGPLFEEEMGVNVTFSFGSTGQLTDQIENGAPYDVFASADTKFIDYLEEKEMLIPNTKTIYSYGRIGVATLVDQIVLIESLKDLLNPEIKKVAIANPDHAPYGLAAQQALMETGIWEELQGKLVYGRNISDTLSFIETGNAEVGIIALSLYNEDKINFHMIDENLHEPLEQSIAVINQTKQRDHAEEFIEFIMGPIGKTIMESYGFDVPD